jgi:hypothetical protein
VLASVKLAKTATMMTFRLITPSSAARRPTIARYVFPTLAPHEQSRDHSRFLKLYLN